MPSAWQNGVQELSELLRTVSVTTAGGASCGIDEGFERWRDLTITVREQQKAIYLIGNGASASMASHFAADLAKNGRLHTQVFSDLSIMTAISNDMGYEWVFAEPLRRRCGAGDMLVAISSSGRSPNILKAVDVAAENGLAVVTLSAMSPDNPLRRAGGLNFYVAADRYGPAETAHAAVLHHWMDLVST